MRQRYTYEISVNNDDDRWQQEVLSDDTFHREPRAVARSLLEGWVIDNPGRAGGERIIVRDLAEHGDVDDGDISARVRVRVFRGSLRDHEPQPVAIGYLGHDEHDLAAYDLQNPLQQLRAKGRELAAGERAQRARAAARKAARDPRVGYGSAAALALLAGWALTRKLRGRRLS